jgi:hypothetical protein
MTALALLADIPGAELSGGIAQALIKPHGVPAIALRGVGEAVGK